MKTRINFVLKAQFYQQKKHLYVWSVASNHININWVSEHRENPSIHPCIQSVMVHSPDKIGN